MERKIKRSKLNTFDMIKWLRSRFDNSKRRNAHYLFSPREQTREREIERIFTEFDADGSGGLSREEIFNMFQGFDIDMPLEKLNELYDSVQKNLKEMDLSKFKQCALSERSNRVFTNIINNMKKEGYMPTKFTDMITYLVYLSKREDLMKRIKDHRSPGSQRVESMLNLFRLSQLAENNKEVNSKRQQLKNDLKTRFLKVWRQVEYNMGISDIEMTPQILGQIKSSYQSGLKSNFNLSAMSTSKYFSTRKLKTCQPN